MMNRKKSVSEALQKLEDGKSLKEYVIDFDRIKVEALDVMKLTKGGVVVPENAIYYNDEDMVYDEDFDDEWVRIDVDPIDNLSNKTEVKIALRKDMKQWIESKNIKLDKLIENLLDNFYRTQKIVSND